MTEKKPIPEWMMDATPVHEWFDVVHHGDAFATQVAGLIVGWRLKDGSYLSAESAVEKGLL